MGDSVQLEKELTLTEITYTNLRRHLTVVLDQVGNDHEFVIVRRRGKKSVAMIPAEELTGLMETAYLLRSPAMKRRLLEAKELTTGVSLEDAREKLGL